MKKIVIMLVLLTSGFASSPQDENESFAHFQAVLGPIVPQRDILNKTFGRTANDQLRARMKIDEIKRDVQLMDALWTAARNGIARNGKATKNTKTCCEGCVEACKGVPLLTDQLYKEITPSVSETDRASVAEAFSKFRIIMANCLKELEAGRFP